MSKIVRALILSALATGAAAVVVSRIQHSKTKQGKNEDAKGPLEVDADTLQEHVVQHLTDELGTML